MATQMAEAAYTASDPDNYTGYRTFQTGGFGFRRDEYFAHITWPEGSHLMPVDAFLRALVRVVAWNFFYGTINFDDVFGTTNLYGRVELYVGRFNDAYRDNGRDYQETWTPTTSGRPSRRCSTTGPTPATTRSGRRRKRRIPSAARADATPRPSAACG